MKILRDNIINRILHRKEIREQREKYRRCQTLANATKSFIHAIGECDSLPALLSIHKDLWSTGFQNGNIGPNPYGMFRTKDILTMKPEEVFLGDIYGLNTHSIPYWEEHKGDAYGTNGFGMDPNLSLYGIILGQYRGRLRSNIETIGRQSADYVSQYRTANR